MLQTSRRERRRTSWPTSKIPSRLEIVGEKYLAQQDPQGMGVYDVREEHEPNPDDYVEHADQEQFEDVAAAM